MQKHLIPIWFFIGVLLTIYAVLIIGAGVYQLVVGTGEQVALAHLHIGIWWGAGMLPLGLVYIIRNWPGRKNNSH